LFAFAPVAMIVIGALGVRFLGWSWQEGFVSVMTAGPAPALGWAPAAALVGVLTGVIGLLVAAFAGWKRYWRKAMLVMGVTLATLAGFGLLTAWVGQSPPIHDVATDWSEPMLFSPAVMTARGEGANIVESSPVVPLEAGAYGGRRIADLNAETCPGARPAIVSLQPQRAYAMAKAAIAQSGMALVTDDPAAGRLEATASSLIYGMKDDIIVRVKPQGIGSRIDIRSVSRVGGADMGVNCRRVSGLTTKMAP
jgi:fatty-acyl-CoA synthase